MKYDRFIYMTRISSKNIIMFFILIMIIPVTLHAYLVPRNIDDAIQEILKDPEARKFFGEVNVSSKERKPIVNSYNFGHEVRRQVVEIEIKGSKYGKIYYEWCIGPPGGEYEHFPNGQSYKIHHVDSCPNAGEVIESFLKHMTERQLSFYAKNSLHNDVRNLSSKKIHLQEILPDIIKKGITDRRLIAVKKIHNQEALVELAKNDSNKLVRLMAIRRIDDQEVLTQLVENDTDAAIRRAASERLDSLRVVKKR